MAVCDSGRLSSTGRYRWILTCAVVVLVGLARVPASGQDGCEWREWPVTVSGGKATETSLEVDLATNAYAASVLDDRVGVRVIGADRQFDLTLQDPGLGQGDPDVIANPLGITFLTYAQSAGAGDREILLSNNLGGFSSPLNVSQSASDDFAPRIGLDTAGEPHLVWTRETGALSEIFYWHRQLLVPQLVAEGATPLIHVDASDVVHVVYRRDDELFHSNNDNISQVFASERPVLASPDSLLTSASFGGDRDGNLYVAYESGGALFLAQAPAGMDFLTPARLDGNGVGDPEMRVRNSRIAIVYTRNGELQYLSGESGVLDLPAQPITNTPLPETEPSLDIDLSGNVHVTFLRGGETFYTNNACTPEAQFSASQTSGEAPLAVQFVDESVGEIKVWLWDFGDGTQSSQPRPEHTYLDPGVFDVTLTVVGVGQRESTTIRRSYISTIAADNTMKMSDHRVLPGQVGVWFPVIGNFESRLQGFQVFGQFDPEFLTYAGYSLETTVTKVLQPEFLQVTGFGSYFEAGVIVDFVPPFDGRTIAPTDEDKRLLNLIFDVPSTAPQGRQTQVELTSDPSRSLVNSIFTVGGFSVVPKLRGAVVTVHPIRFPLPRLFIRGDVDNNRIVDITDAISLLNFQFLGGTKPICLDAGDVLDLGALDITSGITLLNFLFLGGPPPAVPYPNLGLDPSPDALEDC